MNTKLQAKKKALFLQALAETGAVATTCRDIGVPRRTMYTWRKADPDFAEMWDESLDCAAALLEEEARRRAMTGVQRPVYQGGELVGHVTEYSDQLLMLLLRAANPARYRTNAKVETTGASHVTIETGVPMSEAEIAIKLEGILAAAEARGDAQPAQIDARARDDASDLV